MAILGPTTGKIIQIESQPVKSLYDDFISGLQMNPRRISPKYFYDARGSEIFEKITQLDEYYLTKCEEEILLHQSRKILSDLPITSDKKLNIIELGAGDGRKTIHFLQAALNLNLDVTYSPVDISGHALDKLELSLSKKIPQLKCNPVELDLEVDLDKLPLKQNSTNLILFLGSSIGNFNPQEQEEFLTRIANFTKSGDAILTGFDLKKDPLILQRAYDDSLGVTKEFNFNLLERFNRELNANFELSNFRHWPVFNPRTGAMESWLISLCHQTINFDSIHYRLKLKTAETIHVETSWKFSVSEVSDLAQRTQWNHFKNYLDSKGWFVVSLWLQN